MSTKLPSIQRESPTMIEEKSLKEDKAQEEKNMSADKGWNVKSGGDLKKNTNGNENDDDDDEFYKEVEIEDIGDEEQIKKEVETFDEDWETTNKILQQKQKQEEEEKELIELANAQNKIPRPKLSKKPEVIDDFIRNFLVKNSLNETLEKFQEEWYAKVYHGGMKDVAIVPDVYLQNRELDDQCHSLREELEKAREIARKAMGTWDKLRKERDYHRMHHQRVFQEKQQLIKDIKRLKKHCDKYDPALIELKRKYETAMKEKMLVRLEKDKLNAKIKALEITIRDLEEGANKEKSIDVNQSKPKKKTLKEAKLPTEDRVNPYIPAKASQMKIDSMNLTETFEGHSMDVSSIALHPKKSVIVSVSDDATWKMWTIPQGKLIMSGDGHADWISCCDFHPRGTHLATTSGDKTVKLWDFANSCCSATFTDHTQSVWSCAFHDCGDFLVSGSMDQTAKVWDLISGKCKTTLRGHVDSINHVCFQPFTNIICTCSADKTISLWDLRTTLCIQTYLDHNNPCSHAAFNYQGDCIASCDTAGVVMLWDVRKPKLRLRVDVGPHPANSVAFDPSGNCLAVGSQDSTIKLFNQSKPDEISELKGHKDAVQTVLFDREAKFLLSGGSDACVCLWQ